MLTDPFLMHKQQTAAGEEITGGITAGELHRAFLVMELPRLL